MRISRAALGVVGGIILYMIPFLAILLISLSGLVLGREDFFEGVGGIFTEGAEEFSPEFAVKQLIAGIFLLLLMGGFSLYLLLCLLGVILLLVLRELREVGHRLRLGHE